MLTTAAASASPTAYWYLTRGTGTVALILLTLSVALGIANVRRLRIERTPRFVLDAVHRRVSLLAMAFLLVHIATSLLDAYAPIRIVDVVIPFVSAYRPLWLGFGAVAFDLMVAIVITSVLRRRFGYRAWRTTHWAAYASWPVALLHGLGTGSDTTAGWMLLIVGGCVIVMIVAVVSRATAGWPDHLGARVVALAASALVPLGLLAWLPSGPLAAGWAQKAGTPASLLQTSAATGSSTRATSSTSSGSSLPARAAFTANASGTVQQRPASHGRSQVDISLSLSGRKLSTLTIQLRGQALDQGGLEMTSSAVTLGSHAQPSQYRGVVTSLAGTNIVSRVSDASGNQLTLVARLGLNPDSGSASGTVSATP
jgi:Ferric reductase like transmembrane component